MNQLSINRAPKKLMTSKKRCLMFVLHEHWKNFKFVGKSLYSTASLYCIVLCQCCMDKGMVVIEFLKV